MAPTIRSITLSTGTTLNYAEQGPPTGIPMILLHGVTDSWRSFEAVLPHLPESIHAFAVTQRGHGDSDRPRNGYRTRDFAADIGAFASACGLAAAVVVGHSMGSINALRFAIDHPERTLGLVLAASFSGFSSKPDLVQFWETAVAPLTDPVDPGFVREFQESTLAKPVPPEFLEMVVAESLKLPARVWHETFAGFFEDDFAHELDRVKSPTLIVWGDRDGYGKRADQDTLLAGIPGARLQVYEGAGHALHWEEPERFATDIAAFAQSVVT